MLAVALNLSRVPVETGSDSRSRVLRKNSVT